MMRVVSVVAALAGLCRGLIYNTTFPNVTWNDDDWILSTTELSQQGRYQSRVSLSNGYTGINVAAIGPFFEIDAPTQDDVVNGWPLFDRRQTFATIAGFYASVNTTNGTNFPWLVQYGGESVIAGIPHWSGLLIESRGHVLDASVDAAAEITNFVSTLDHKRGVKTWSYTWTPGDGPALNITYRMLVHKLFVNQAAVEVSVTSELDANVTVVDVLEGDCAVRTDLAGTGYDAAASQIWSAVRPNWIGNVTAYVYSSIVGDPALAPGSGRRYDDAAFIGGNSSSTAQAFSLSLVGGEAHVITKYVGIASSEAFADPQATARNASNAAAKVGFSALVQTNAEEWAAVMPTDSVDNFALQTHNFSDVWWNKELVTLQILAITNPWHILSNTVSANAIKAADNNTRLDIWSIPVGGLGSSSYAGWIFWDAEIWMAPGIVVTNPQAAKQIANYRRELFPQAQANINDAYQGSTNATRFTPGGAAYPWISGRFGNCTAAGPCFDYEYHLNGDIALELYNWYVATGDTETFKSEFFPIYDAAAYFFAELVERNASTGMYELFNATDPDEYANHVDNAAFTQTLIKTVLADANELRARFGMPPNTTWTTISDNILIPTDAEAGIILEYGTMNGTISVKQADVVLVDDFLDFPNPYSLSDLDYYAGKQSINGPGMTYGVYSIVANEISPSGCASYTYDLYGSLPYVRAPWFQYSEQLVDEYDDNGGTHPAFPFLTGMGGAHRVAIFGYLGLRLFLDTLNIDPNLPPQIPHIRYRTFYWQGHPISAVSNATHTTLRRLAQPLPNANSTYSTGAIPVTIGLYTNNTFHLAPNATLTIPNRQAGFNATVPGNLVQCHPVLSPEDYLPGQFPSSAVDGAASTKWQPAFANASSELTVQMADASNSEASVGILIAGFFFDWGQRPPTDYSVFFSNDSTNWVNITNNYPVGISAPYDAAQVADIVPYASNTTNQTLGEWGPIYGARYAQLWIHGSHEEEFVVNKTGTGATVAEWAVIRADGGQLRMQEEKRGMR